MKSPRELEPNKHTIGHVILIYTTGNIGTTPEKKTLLCFPTQSRERKIDGQFLMRSK